MPFLLSKALVVVGVPCSTAKLQERIDGGLMFGDEAL